MAKKTKVAQKAPEPVKIPDYQQRVIDERDDLLVKSKKLQDFTVTDAFRGLKLRDRNLLEEQFRIMGLYVTILNERISRF